MGLISIIKIDKDTIEKTITQTQKVFRTDLLYEKKILEERLLEVNDMIKVLDKV